jgi:hypothetical protein
MYIYQQFINISNWSILLSKYQQQISFYRSIFVNSNLTGHFKLWQILRWRLTLVTWLLRILNTNVVIIINYVCSISYEVFCFLNFLHMICTSYMSNIICIILDCKLYLNHIYQQFINISNWSILLSKYQRQQISFYRSIFVNSNLTGHFKFHKR